MFEDTKTLTAPPDRPLRLWIEPWAAERQFPPGSVVILRAQSPREGRIEVVAAADATWIYGWPGSTLEILVGGEQVAIFDNPPPALPEGMSMRDFIGGVRGARPPVAEGGNDTRLSEARWLDEFARRIGLKPSRNEMSASFGDRLLEYASPTLAVRVVRDKGQWSIDVSDREGRPDESYDAALLRDLIEGRGEDVLAFPEQVAVVERGWKEIALRFGAARRDETHARLGVLRKERMQRMFPGLRRSERT